MLLVGTYKMRDPQVVHTAIDAALGNGYRLIGERITTLTVCMQHLILVVLMKGIK